MQVTLTALPGIPIVRPGDDIAELILEALDRSGLALEDGDILAVTSKIVSKAEGRFVDLREIEPSLRALEISSIVGKDPRLVEVILRESTHISRMAPGVLIVTHRLGFTSANAGVDHSNAAGSEDIVLLLPEDPDRSARELRERLSAATGAEIGLVITDSHGRPFRLGTVGVAIGVAGMPALLDLRGRPDLFGRELRVTTVGFADEIAAAAGLLTGQADEGMPVVLVRGLDVPTGNGSAADLIRPPERDLYR